MDIRTDAQDAARLTRSQLRAQLRGIYAIVNAEQPDPIALASAVLRGGCRIVQYRAKGAVVAAQARRLRELTRSYGALFILNDHWRPVEEFDADGVHLGPDDTSFSELAAVRGALANRLIGFSCGTPQEAQAAERAGADYAGVGSVFATSSKLDAGDPIGLEGLAGIVSATRLPVAAIGGIDAAVLPSVRSTGAAMAAVLSAISAAADPFAATVELVRTWSSAS